MASTVKPAGLSVVRDGLKFTLSWKVADKDYDGGVQAQWRNYTGPGKGNKWSAWTNVNPLPGDSYVSKSFSASTFWPVANNYFYGIAFRVRGKRATADGKSYDWSAWEQKIMDLKTPNNPVVTQELDSEFDNKAVFSWTVNVSDEDVKPFYNCEWQSILVKNSLETDGSKLSWKTSTLGWLTGTGSAEGSYTTPAEDWDQNAADSLTRWFRIRARGCGGNGTPAGCSAWRYAKHVYATPKDIWIDKTNTKKAADSMRTAVIWSSPQDAAHPIDKTEVQWVIDNPSAAGLAPPNDPSWTTAATYADTAQNDRVVFTPDQLISLDQCMWIRVVSTHDRIAAKASQVFRVANGPLSMPENLSVTVGSEDRRVAVSAELISDVPDAKIAVVFRRDTGDETVIGVIDTPGGETGGTFRYPVLAEGQTFKIGVYAFQGRADGVRNAEDLVTRYTMNTNMQSSTLWEGGYVPHVPGNVTAVTTDALGEVLVRWEWKSWAAANRAEISWSQNSNAWESTEQPSTYMLTSLSLARWYVSGLDIGTWYFRVRLARETDNGITYGPYSDPVSVNISATPTKPALSVSRPVLNKGDQLTFEWTYASEDGAKQAKAELQRVNSGSIYPVVNGSDTRTTIKANWDEGDQYYRVKVTSDKGVVSEWSDTITFTIAPRLSCVLSYVNGQQVTFSPLTVNGRASVFSLVRMPMTMTITGAPVGGRATLIIEREEDYSMLRPDGTTTEGHAGETVALFRQGGNTTGVNTFVITPNDLIGALDDGARYRFIATVEDSLGQIATATEVVPPSGIRRAPIFEVHWADQAKIPTATVEMIGTAAKITASQPEGDTQDAVCDIYRLTADLPELIVEDGEFGTAYVDPYPAIGKGFGHRVVYRTANGDYITADNELAMTDITDGDGDLLDIDYGIIDFDGYSLPFRYNTELTGDWTKDFKETRYLGGTIVGDWNKGVSRTMSVNAVLVVEALEEYQTLRRLAEYTGICHVRTPDGSSFAADVQVSDANSYSVAGKINSFTLNITRVEPVALDGIPYSEWVTA